MKIACDVKGTLNGYRKEQVLKILEIFQKLGYEIFIWSNLYSYATDAVVENNLKAIAQSKFTKGDVGNNTSEFYDFAIEDDRDQSYLAVKKFIWVDEIPEDLVQVELFVKELLEGQ